MRLRQHGAVLHFAKSMLRARRYAQAGGKMLVTVKKFGGSQTLRTDRIRIYKKYGMSKGYWFYRWAYERIKFLAG